MRDSFIFYRSFFEAITELDNDSKLKVYEAIADYSLNKNEPELSGISKTVFILIKPQLEANIKRFENGKQPKLKQKISKTEAKNKQKISKPKANNNVNDNVNVNNNNNENAKESIIPSFEIFKNYALENKTNVDLIDLELKYKSWIANDWRDGHDNPIKKWKSKLLNTLPYIKETNQASKPGLVKIELKRV